ncbi:MAG: NUDIX hydrolase [candidate division Zixibacteria bacterium]|nr:NUDIX hydrolase [candidate division Zixibacteria bacterium]
MYVTRSVIEQAIEQYGQPRTAEFVIVVDKREFNFIRASQKDGRRHDTTFYIVKDGRIVVNAKHNYRPGMYRAPSGGLAPGETIEEGLKREAMEETGCEVTIERFLLKTDVKFVCKSDDAEKEIEWHSYVFQAAYTAGDFDFTDKREIREVRLATLEEFEDFSKIMRKSNIGGLHYRAALHDAVKGLLQL